MSISLIRVDNRLVHGQILEGWVPFLKSMCIIVVNDEVAGDMFRESVIRMAIPSDIELQVWSVDDFAENYVYTGKKKNAIVLFSDVNDVIRAYTIGFRFSLLNIGNIHKKNDTVCISASIFLSDRDIEDIMFLVKSGVRVEIQTVPMSKSLEFCDILTKIVL